MADEINWWSEEFENLPVVGSIWVNYFIEAFSNPAADEDGDSRLSFNEIHEFANEAVQKYMSDYIFSNQEYLNLYLDIGYNPFAKPAYPNAVMNNYLGDNFIMKSMD
ncbi:MAG: hypothetical protein JEY99_07420 [Spirochaetales bacterium]|nr:hypothetical protein [Spirochaetales bacterium]